MKLLKWTKTGLKSPMARAKGLGSARSGMDHWIAQRVTAIALMPLVLWLIWSIIGLIGADHTTFTAWLAQPVNAILMILFVLSSLYHAKLGAQTVTEDYCHDEGMKIVKLVAQKLFFFVIGVTCLFSILKIAFGG